MDCIVVGKSTHLLPEVSRERVERQFPQTLQRERPGWHGEPCNLAPVACCKPGSAFNKLGQWADLPLLLSGPGLLTVVMGTPSCPALPVPAPE